MCLPLLVVWEAALGVPRHPAAAGLGEGAVSPPVARAARPAGPGRSSAQFLWLVQLQGLEAGEVFPPGAAVVPSVVEPSVEEAEAETEAGLDPALSHRQAAGRLG